MMNGRGRRAKSEEEKERLSDWEKGRKICRSHPSEKGKR